MTRMASQLQSLQGTLQRHSTQKNGAKDVADARPENVIVPVHRIMDRAPYTILEDMPAPRFYPLFVKAGVTAAAVIAESGEFIGVMRRANLISQSRDVHLPPTKQRKTIRATFRRSEVRTRTFSGSNASVQHSQSQISMMMSPRNSPKDCLKVSSCNSAQSGAPLSSSPKTSSYGEMNHSPSASTGVGRTAPSSRTPLPGMPEAEGNAPTSIIKADTLQQNYILS